MSDRDSGALYLAKIGKTFGLKGLLKIRLDSDFPDFFTIGRTLKAALGDQTLELTVDRFDAKRALIGFEGVNAPEEAARLTNYELFTSIADTKAAIKLNEGERFWFELIGMAAIENDEIIGKIVEITNGDPPLLTLEIKGKTQRLIAPYSDRFVEGAKDNRLIMKNIRALIDEL
ncbi:MAG: ribosome maturation factor RimM [Helicobacteraceae bacterium]|jgi:16S rRNA processing protein RimM|nr:ribosome maturation factor RimM [Helicobacteraceae bacterium]